MSRRLLLPVMRAMDPSKPAGRAREGRRALDQGVRRHGSRQLPAARDAVSGWRWGRERCGAREEILHARLRWWPVHRVRADPSLIHATSASPGRWEGTITLAIFWGIWAMVTAGIMLVDRILSDDAFGRPLQSYFVLAAITPFMVLPVYFFSSHRSDTATKRWGLTLAGLPLTV